MTPALIVTVNEEVLLSLALILFVTLLILKLMRRRTPDPKLELLLSLMEGMPRDEDVADSSARSGEEVGGAEERGPWGAGRIHSLGTVRF